MELDFDYNDCIKLHDKIKEKIRGKVYVTKRKNNITIYIIGYKNTKFKYIVNEYESKIKNYDVLTRKIVSIYRKYMLNKIFIINKKYERSNRIWKQNIR